MNLTKHANKRKQQRCMSDLTIRIIENHGRATHAPGGAEKIFFGKQECHRLISELKKTIQLVERAKGGSIIVGGGKVLTAYKS